MVKKNNLSSILFIFLLALAVAAFPTGNVSARLARCRTDPIFYLSNGDKVTVILDIGTDAVNVRNVNYVIHVPAEVKVTKVVFTAGGIGKKESYRAVQDSSVGVYTTETVVTSQGGPYTVTATSSLAGGISASATGFNGDYLIVTLTQTVLSLNK